jgi:transcriptional regulator with XRE-family HTH domain
MPFLIISHEPDCAHFQKRQKAAAVQDAGAGIGGARAAEGFGVRRPSAAFPPDRFMKIHRRNRTSPPNFKPIKRSIREPVILALAGIIRELREARGWKVGELAREAKLSRFGLSLFETHQREPSAHLVVRLARALRVTPEELFGKARRRAARWPAQCHECNYCCIENGRLVWLNPRRGCLRPAH